MYRDQYGEFVSECRGGLTFLVSLRKRFLILNHKLDLASTQSSGGRYEYWLRLQASSSSSHTMKQRETSFRVVFDWSALGITGHAGYLRVN